MPISRCGCGRVQAAAAPRAGDHGLRDAGTPAGAGAGADGDAGIKVDRDTLSRMSNAFAQKMAGLEARSTSLAGETFNVGSPAQLGEILFDKMGLEGGKKGKTGAYSTGAMCWRIWRPSTTCRARARLAAAVEAEIDLYRRAAGPHQPETGRVHTSYSIAGANTGRLASTDPNLQNIPVRTEEGRRIREAFVAEPGKVLVSLDYSQIELRILAHIAGIDALKQAFRDGQDIHAHDRVGDVRRAAGRDDAGCAPAGQGDQFRRDLRHLGLRPGAQPAHPAGRGAGLHRPLFRALPRHPRPTWTTPRPSPRSTAMCRRCSAARSTRPRSTPRGRGRALPPRRDQRADPGHRGRHHPPRDDPDARRHRGAAREDAAAGA
jgi:hypothetical protein